MSALSDDRFVPERQRHHEVVQSGCSCRESHVGSRRGRTAVSDVLQNGRIEGNRFLLDEPHVAPQVVERERSQIATVEEHQTAVGIGEPQRARSAMVDLPLPLTPTIATIPPAPR